MPDYELIVLVSVHHLNDLDKSAHLYQSLSAHRFSVGYRYMKQTIAFLITAAALLTPSLAQTPNTNQAAVDTLTKDVATLVLANQTGDKAAEIVNELSTCGGCDAIEVIRRVGGWDAVGVKLEELSRLKNTARFQAMSPGEANAAIRQELTRFYGRYKKDKNYGVPLAPEVQVQMLAKIDRIVPPNALQPTSSSNEPASGQPEQAVVPAAAGNVDANAVRISQLERAVKEERANRVWMLIMSAIAGLLVGAGVVYFMLYRGLRGEVGRLTDANAKLSQEVDKARRPKVANELRQPQPESRPNLDASDLPQPEQRSVSEVTKPTTAETPATPPTVSSVAPTPTLPNQDKPAEPAAAPEPVLAPIPPVPPSTPSSPRRG